MSWIAAHATDIGKLILRVTIALFVFSYGIQKIMDPSMVGYIGSLFSELHLPALIAYGVYLGEVVAPILVIIGWRTKIAAMVMSFTMFTVILIGHTNQIFPPSEFVWSGIELQTLFLLNSFAVSCLGAGKFALSHRNAWD